LPRPHPPRLPRCPRTILPPPHLPLWCLRKWRPVSFARAPVLQRLCGSCMCSGAYHPLSCPACAAWDWKGRRQESEGQVSGAGFQVSGAKPGFRSRKGRFQVPGSRCQGLNQDSGFGIQESGVRSQDEEHPVRTFCSVFCGLRSLLPAATGPAVTTTVSLLPT
jgi:hypothetical protein